MTQTCHFIYLYFHFFLIFNFALLIFSRSNTGSPGQDTGVGSLSVLQGIFPTQGPNPGLLHCRRILYQLSHKGSPSMVNGNILNKIKESIQNEGDLGFEPWFGNISWRRERLSWPGEFHGLYCPWGRKESDMTERLSLWLWTHQSVSGKNPENCKSQVCILL